MTIRDAKCEVSGSLDPRGLEVPADWASLRSPENYIGYEEPLIATKDVHKQPTMAEGRRAWPLAARAACDLADTATTTELLALLDGYPLGELAPMQRAERDLAHARLAAADAGPDPGPDPGPACTAAITGLRQHSTPYHLAHGLLDHADYLTQLGDTQAVDVATAEARAIASRLRCQPLLDRAGTTQPATPAPRSDQQTPRAQRPAFAS